MSEPQRPIPGTPPDREKAGEAFRDLCEVIARLRAPDGCPWDREQTLESIKPYTLEETHELLEAIDSGDDEAIVEELGDVLLQVVLDAQIGADEARFNLIDVMETVSKKLVHRHPHVFGEEKAANAADVLQHWDKAKEQEKKRDSVLDGIPGGLAQLARAVRLTKRGAKVGFDFPQRAMLFDKLQEEINELAAELFEDGAIPDVPVDVEGEVIPDQSIEDPEKQSRIEGEIGDLLFVIANIARRWNVNPEEALRKSNQKFARRFQGIEKALATKGQSIRDVSLQEMEDIYQWIKQQETKD